MRFPPFLTMFQEIFVAHTGQLSGHFFSFCRDHLQQRLFGIGSVKLDPFRDPGFQVFIVFGSNPRLSLRHAGIFQPSCQTKQPGLFQFAGNEHFATVSADQNFLKGFYGKTTRRVGSAVTPQAERHQHRSHIVFERDRFVSFRFGHFRLFHGLGFAQITESRGFIGVIVPCPLQDPLGNFGNFRRSQGIFPPWHPLLPRSHQPVSQQTPLGIAGNQ